MAEKIKVLTISDSIFLPSGVAGQTRLVVESLLKSGKFQVYCLGGAIKHQNYSPTKTQEYGDDLIHFPVDGFGSPDLVRQMINQYKIDIVWCMADPRLLVWLFEIENEIRKVCPIVYYEIWDNFPAPTFNHKYYTSCDLLVPISGVTDKINEIVAPEVERIRIPHCIDPKVFYKLSDSVVSGYKKSAFNGLLKDRFVFFFNSRNARRKHTTTLAWWFADFLEKYDLKKKVCLLMHTDPVDEHGTDLPAILEERGLINGEILISAQKLPADQMNILYNLADCTVSLSDAEGWGLSTHESLATETPIIVTMTGGPQEQVTDGTNWFGVGIYPTSKMLVGSPTVPFINEDRISQDDFDKAFKYMYDSSPEQRASDGKLGRQHIEKNFNFKDCMDKWVEVMLGVHEKHGSWDTRKNYTSWTKKEVTL